MTRHEARDVIERSPLSQHAELLASLLEPSIDIAPTKATSAPNSRSFFGGLPLLPDDVEWPFWDRRDYLHAQIDHAEKMKRRNPRGVRAQDKSIARHRDELARGEVPLSFLAQIHLPDVAQFAPAGNLLNTGTLWFFYETSCAPWGYDPRARGAWRVVYDPGTGESWNRCAAPDSLPERERFGYAQLRFRESWHLPSDPPEPLSEDFEEYIDLKHKLVGEDRHADHRLFGHPDEIQGDMRWLCQMASNGVYCGDASASSDPRVSLLESGVSDWRMLLQLDSDEENLGWMWGDVGRLYFWIREQELRARDFCHTWFDLQCY